MRYIKDFFALGVIAGLSGLVAGAGTVDFIVFGASTVMVATCAIGVCIADVYPIKERTLDEIKTAHLEQIKGIVLDYTTPEECGTLTELQAYAKNHGYKSGWAYYQAKRRKII